MTEIVANSCTKICFQLGSKFEVELMAKHMGLTKEQMDELYHLGRGEAICRTGLYYTQPVRLNVFNLQHDDIDNTELERFMRPK